MCSLSNRTIIANLCELSWWSFSWVEVIYQFSISIDITLSQLLAAWLIIKIYFSFSTMDKFSRNHETKGGGGGGNIDLLFINKINMNSLKEKREIKRLLRFCFLFYQLWQIESFLWRFDFLIWSIILHVSAA